MVLSGNGLKLTKSSIVRKFAYFLLYSCKLSLTCLLSTKCLLLLTIFLVFLNLHQFHTKVPKRPSKQTVKLESLLPATGLLYNESVLYPKIEEYSNVALEYYNRWRTEYSHLTANSTARSNVTFCPTIQMVPPYLLKHSNQYWQIANVPPHLTLHLFNAYYDNRQGASRKVRILSATNRQGVIKSKSLRLWCLLWFDHQKAPIIVPVSDIFNTWPQFYVHPNEYGPQLITCDIPKEYSAEQIPQAVSLQTSGDCANLPKEPTNILRILRFTRNPKHHPKRSIAVCVQALRFSNVEFSVRLVEWLEMIRLLGADQVYLYAFETTESMAKVLQFYQKEGFVQTPPLSLPGEQANIRRLYATVHNGLGEKFWPQELLELNDCLYRSIGRHEYLALLDIDEIIMPMIDDSWQSLLARMEKEHPESNANSPGYYLARHSFVYEDYQESRLPDGETIPEYLYTMRHTYREEPKGPSRAPKSLHRISRTVTTSNHKALECFNESSPSGHSVCPRQVFDPLTAVMFHYRHGHSKLVECTQMNCTLHDRTAWRFYRKLKKQVEDKLWSIFGSQ